MIKRHYVVSFVHGGDPELALMKDYLRRHLDLLPPGTDPTHTTSHQLRSMLQKTGWRMEEQSDRVVLVEPDPHGRFEYAVDLLELEEEFELNDEPDENEITFGLERDLQVALRRDISAIEPGLNIVDGGSERITEAGRIDITARDSSGQFVVIELKAGIAQPAIVAQVMAYIAAIQEEDGHPVRGVVIAGDFSPRVVLAARAIPNLELRKYSFNFSFEDVS